MYTDGVINGVTWHRVGCWLGSTCHALSIEMPSATCCLLHSHRSIQALLSANPNRSKPRTLPPTPHLQGLPVGALMGFRLGLLHLEDENQPDSIEFVFKTREKEIGDEGGCRLPPFRSRVKSSVKWVLWWLSSNPLPDRASSIGEEVSRYWESSIDRRWVFEIWLRRWWSSESAITGHVNSPRFLGLFVRVHVAAAVSSGRLQLALASWHHSPHLVRQVANQHTQPTSKQGKMMWCRATWFCSQPLCTQSLPSMKLVDLTNHNRRFTLLSCCQELNKWQATSPVTRVTPSSFQILFLKFTIAKRKASIIYLNYNQASSCGGGFLRGGVTRPRGPASPLWGRTFSFGFIHLALAWLACLKK